MQGLLQRTSLTLFRKALVATPLATYTEEAWRLLPVPAAGPALRLEQLAYFEPETPFFRRRVAYLDRFVQGCDRLQESGKLGGKLICSRYTDGLPLLQPHAIKAFGDTIRAYRDAARAATG